MREIASYDAVPEIVKNEADEMRKSYILSDNNKRIMRLEEIEKIEDLYLLKNSHSS